MSIWDKEKVGKIEYGHTQKVKGYLDRSQHNTAVWRNPYGTVWVFQVDNGTYQVEVVCLNSKNLGC